MASFTVLDYVFGGLLLLGAVRGALIGLSRQLFTLLTLAAAVWLSLRFQPDLARRMAGGADSPDALLRAAAFVLIFAGVFVVAMLGRGIGRLLFRFTFSPLVDRAGGALVGMATTGLIIVAAIAMLSLVPHESLHRTVTEESWLGRRVAALFPRLFEEISQRIPFALPSLPESEAPAAPPETPTPPAQPDATTPAPPPG